MKGEKVVPIRPRIKWGKTDEETTMVAGDLEWKDTRRLHPYEAVQFVKQLAAETCNCYDGPPAESDEDFAIYLMCIPCEAREVVDGKWGESDNGGVYDPEIDEDP